MLFIPSKCLAFACVTIFWDRCYSLLCLVCMVAICSLNTRTQSLHHHKIYLCFSALATLTSNFDKNHKILFRCHTRQRFYLDEQLTESLIITANTGSMEVICSLTLSLDFWGTVGLDLLAENKMKNFNCGCSLIIWLQENAAFRVRIQTTINCV